jgi:uncharacterized membrane protein YkvA (DUF1232 family)
VSAVLQDADGSKILGISMNVFKNAKDWARRVKRDSVTLWFAYRDPGTPMMVKALSIFVVAYALSPIDLIPDFIPVLGYLDDVILLPVLIWIAVRLMPPQILLASRQSADEWMANQGRVPRNYYGAFFVLAAWLGCSYLAWRWFTN